MEEPHREGTTKHPPSLSFSDMYSSLHPPATTTASTTDTSPTRSHTHTSDSPEAVSQRIRNDLAQRIARLQAQTEEREQSRRQQVLQEETQAASAPIGGHAALSMLPADTGGEESSGGFEDQEEHALMRQQLEQANMNLQSQWAHSSPTGSGIVRTSSSIIRAVLSGDGTDSPVGSPAPLRDRPMHTSDLDTDHGLDPLGSPHRRAVALETMNQMSTLPEPSGATSDHEKLLYYVDYLKHRRHEVRLSSLRELRQLLLAVDFQEEVKETVAAGVSTSLEVYENQEDRFNELCLDVLGLLGPAGAESVPVLMKMLRDLQESHHHEKLVKTLFLLGDYGIQALVEGASEAYTEWDSFILTHLGNHPLVQGLVILPSLVRECRQGDQSQKTKAVKAIGQLYQLATPAIPILLDLLVSGVVCRNVVVSAIRACGVEGERVLIKLVHTAEDAKVRAAAAHGLGLPRYLNPPFLTVVVDADVTTSYGTPPHIVFGAGGSEDDVDHIIFDSRELISSIRRGIQDHEYTEPVPSEFSLAPGGVPALSGRGTLPVEGLDANASVQLPSTARGTSPLTQLETSEDAVSALVNALADRESIVRAEAAAAVGVIGLSAGVATLPALLESLQDRDASVREATVVTLGKLGPEVTKDALQLVIPLIKDEFWKVRFAAVQTVGKFGRDAKAAVPTLVRVLKDGSVKRPEVAITLSCLGKKGVLALMELLRADAGKASVQVKTACAYGLSHVDVACEMVDLAVETLFQASQDKIPAVRRAIVEALGVLGRRAKETVTYLRTRSLLPFIYGFLKDRDAQVREASAMVLSNAGPHGELLLIEGLLKDSNTTIRASAAFGLMRIGPRTIRTLLLAMNDKEPSVRQAVSGAIQSLGLGPVLDVLRQRPVAHRESVITSANEILQSSVPRAAALDAFLATLIARLESLPVAAYDEDPLYQLSPSSSASTLSDGGAPFSPTTHPPSRMSFVGSPPASRLANPHSLSPGHSSVGNHSLRKRRQQQQREFPLAGLLSSSPGSLHRSRPSHRPPSATTSKRATTTPTSSTARPHSPFLSPAGTGPITFQSR